MRTLINATYKKDPPQITITCGDRIFDTLRIKDIPVEQWVYPFCAKGVRWNGLYEELKDFAGTGEFSLNFDSDDTSFDIVNHALSQTPVKLIGSNNAATIVYRENPFTTKITVNGKVFDTTRIQNRSIDEWINPISIRDLQWNGIFKELEDFIGTDMFTVHFVGNPEFMELLMDQAPADVSVFYRDPQVLNKLSRAKVPGHVATNPLSKVNTENISQVAKKAAETIKEGMSPGDVKEDTSEIPIKNSFIRNNIMTICAVIALVLLFLPFAAFSGKVDGQVVTEAVRVSGFETMFGMKAVKIGTNRSIFAFLMLIVPVVIIILNYIRPLQPYKKIIAVAAPILGIIAELVALLDIRGIFKTFIVAGEGIKLKTSLGIGFLLVLMCYVLIAVLGLIIYHGMKLPKKKN